MNFLIEIKIKIFNNKILLIHIIYNKFNNKKDKLLLKMKIIYFLKMKIKMKMIIIILINKIYKLLILKKLNLKWNL